MFKTDFIMPTSGSAVLCWDELFTNSKNPKEKVECHGEIGFVIDRANPLDIDHMGQPLGKRADECFLVMFPSKKSPMVVHAAWLKVIESEVN